MLRIRIQAVVAFDDGVALTFGPGLTTRLWLKSGHEWRSAGVRFKKENMLIDNM